MISEPITSPNRRRFLGAAAIAFAAAPFAVSGTALAQAGNANSAGASAVKPRFHRAFGHAQLARDLRVREPFEIRELHEPAPQRRKQT